MKKFFVAKIDESGNFIKHSPQKNYLVVNIDEPYAPKIFEMIRDHEKEKGTWDGPDNFEDFVKSIDSNN